MYCKNFRKKELHKNLRPVASYNKWHPFIGWNEWVSVAFQPVSRNCSTTSISKSVSIRLSIHYLIAWPWPLSWLSHVTLHPATRCPPTFPPFPAAWSFPPTHTPVPIFLISPATYYIDFKSGLDSVCLLCMFLGLWVSLLPAPVHLLFLRVGQSALLVVSLCHFHF